MLAVPTYLSSGRLCASILLAVSLQLVTAQPAIARDIHVALTGLNTNTGGAADPYRTIVYGMTQAASGDTVRVHAGTYEEYNIPMRSGVWLVSADGLHAARIYSGPYRAVRFFGVSNCGIDGFEIYGDYAAGSPSDGLVRVYQVSNVTLRNLLVHDAPADCDCIKVGGAGV